MNESTQFFIVMFVMVPGSAFLALGILKLIDFFIEIKQDI